MSILKMNKYKRLMRCQDEQYNIIACTTDKGKVSQGSHFSYIINKCYPWTLPFRDD